MPHCVRWRLQTLTLLFFLSLMALPVSAQQGGHALMLYSNSPERVSGPAVLYQNVAQGSCRLLFHHLNASQQPMVLEVHVINLAEHASAFMSRIYTAQHIDPTQAGHYATQQFWLEDRPLLPSPAVGALADETLLSVTWPHGVTTSGLAVLNLPEPALVRVLALPTTGAMPCPAEPLSSAAFPLTDLFEEVPYSLPRDPLVLSVGRANYLNNTSHVLRGNYGVIHHYRIIAANPTEQPQYLSIYTRQAGGVSRAFVRVDETLLPMPTSATYEKRLLAQKTVPARSEMVFDLATMPQSGSNMPIDFILESSGPEANTATRSHSVATSKASR